MAEDDNTPFTKKPSDETSEEASSEETPSEETPSEETLSEELESQGISPEAEGFMPEGLKALLERPITEEDVYFLLGRYPYLEICDVNNPMKEEGAIPELRKTSSGWVVHDYGNYMAVSAGVNAFGNKSLKDIAKEYELAIHDDPYTRRKGLDQGSITFHKSLFALRA